MKGNARAPHALAPAVLACICAVARAAELTDAALDRYIWEASRPGGPSSRSEKTRRIGEELERAVRELLEKSPLSPLEVKCGITGLETWMGDPGEHLRCLSAALPHLEGGTRRALLAYLASVFTLASPFDPKAAMPKGGSRNLYDIVPGDRARYNAVGHWRLSPLERLYGVWCFFEHGNQWPAAQGMWTRIRSSASRDLGRIRTGKMDDDVRLNYRLSGAIALARIAHRLGHRAPADQVVPVARDGLRLVIERARSRGRIVQSAAHRGFVPLMTGLAPELGRAIREQATEAVEYCMEEFKLGGSISTEGQVFRPGERGVHLPNLSLMRAKRPGWFIAWGERFIGGENFTNPPDFARAVFGAFAFIEESSPDVLARCVDIPWCVGDLYYIEKLALVLRAASGPRWVDVRGGR